MGKIKTLLRLSFFSIIYFSSKLIKKNKKIWIFGAWFGEKYADNSKYLFEYINKNNPEIKAIWLTNNDDTLKLIRKKGYKVYKTYSLLGFYYSMRAYFGFVCTEFRDINHCAFTGKWINLWHGIPLKKVVYDDKIKPSDNINTLKKKIFRTFFPFIHFPEDYDYVIASSNIEAKNLSSAFKISLKNILITGLPRNDVFTSEIREIKKIIYMPTHRKEGKNDIIKFFLKELENINKELKKINITLYIKLHYYHMKNINIKNYTNIFFIRDSDIDQDIYSVINNFDLLITDYSSIYFDFLLTNRPIIFAPFDYNEYITNDRELYFEYNKVTPGPKCNNWKEIIEWIKKFKQNPKLYFEERKKILNTFHKYKDNKNSQRVYKEIINLDKDNE